MKTTFLRALLLTGFACFAALSLHTSSCGSVPEEVDALARTGVHQPLRAPDRVILTWSDDPATTQSVTWRTSLEVRAAVAEIAVADDGPLFADGAARVGAVSEEFESDLGPAMYHSATFTGLEPGELYVYRVGDGEVWSEWNQFKTASNQPEMLTFLYIGDAQNDVYSMWSRLIREGYSMAPEADFIIHAGDLINRANRDAEWGEWFMAAGWINSKLQNVPTPGNHEYERGDDEVRTLSRHWRPQFTLPSNGPEGLEETCYYLDIQGVRIVSLNSNERLEEQAEWLDRTLAENPHRWVIATHHHPVYSAASDRDNPRLRELWQPVYDKHRVDLVLQGHDHTYARSNLTTGVNVQAGEGGTVYVVSVSGPKMYNVRDEDWMVRRAEDTQLFQVVRIDGDSLRYESYTARGALYDAFELTKRDGAPNELVNRVPKSPERRR